jgi:Glycoside hydrolase family 5 C-terminal domain/Cellulase (glycosyl hydrolase family 5)
VTLTVSGPWFADEHGRLALLRGVNLAGSSKVPTVPDGSTHLPTDFSGHRDVSFVGRPFPLEDADEHYARLRHWGFDCLRFLVTWEAVEHSGPGERDEAYLDYLRAVVERAGRHGFTVFVDPHQDVWSRMSGGDGAPGWTLELAGLDVTRLDEAEAAVTMQRRAPGDYPPMAWTTNQARLASATMFSLFFAGDRVAPDTRLHTEPAQAFLQRHFIDAMRAVAERVADLPHVVGYDTLNEPSPGYLGVADLGQVLPVLAPGPRLTGLDSLSVGAGFPRDVEVVAAPTVGGPPRAGSAPEAPTVGGPRTRVTLNPRGVSAWRHPGADVWRAHGVWDVGDDGRPRLLRPDHFADVDFRDDCLRPFARAYAEALSDVHRGAVFFVEGTPGDARPLRWDAEAPVVNASHWYDARTLFERRYDPAVAWERGTGRPVRGEEAVRRLFAEQIGSLVAVSRESLSDAPTLVGEFGVAFDLDEGAAFATGDFSAHERALETYFAALDANLVHATLWNYTPDNDNAHGDRWNGEDLSIYSRDQAGGHGGPDDGGRAVRGFCRPRVRRAAGVPTRQEFDPATGLFTLEVDVDAAIDAPTTVYVPRAHYPHGGVADVSSGHARVDARTQTVTWSGADPGAQRLSVMPLHG